MECNNVTEHENELFTPEEPKPKRFIKSYKIVEPSNHWSKLSPKNEAFWTQTTITTLWHKTGLFFILLLLTPLPRLIPFKTMKNMVLFLPPPCRDLSPYVLATKCAGKKELNFFYVINQATFYNVMTSYFSVKCSYCCISLDICRDDNIVGWQQQRRRPHTKKTHKTAAANNGKQTLLDFWHRNNDLFTKRVTNSLLLNSITTMIYLELEMVLVITKILNWNSFQSSCLVVCLFGGLSGSQCILHLLQILMELLINNKVEFSMKKAAIFALNLSIIHH